MSTLITALPWSRITAAVKQKPNRCFVAVAYFSAVNRLPLKEGSTLIVDMSETSVRSGRTNPRELLKLINKGVDVHSVGNLHAKVFVAGNRIYVGSTNASDTSAVGGLVEAVVESTDRNLVSAGRRFVKSLRGDLVTPNLARAMRRIYKPPKFGHARKRKRARETAAIPVRAPLWIVQLVREAWDDDATRNERLAMPVARRRLRSSRRFRVEDFHWIGRRFLDRFDRGHSVIQVLEEDDGRCMVHAASRVIHVRRYKHNGKSHAIVFLEVSKKQRAKNVKRLIKQIGPAARALKKGPARLIRDRALATALKNAWPFTSETPS
jgi:hypothetical protein